MSSKFNPNASSFTPSLKGTGSSANSLSTLVSSSQTSQNLSSHAAPPPSKGKAGLNGNNSARKNNNKKRESKGQNKQKSHQTTTPQGVFHDELDLDIEDQLISGNLKTRGRRGQISINHLLDFALPPRETGQDSYKGKSVGPRRSRRRSSNEERIVLTGPEFINANYRFVVDHRHGYKGQIMDPNLVLPDLSILRVIVPKGHHCPICLADEIVAPRMSSCGHIFCHSCLLSFIDSEPIVKKGMPVFKYKECPLCSNFVKPHEIKPVLINSTDERFDIPKVGQDVVLKLMARPNGSILSLLHGLNLSHKKIDNLPWYSDSEVYPYSRILKGGLKFSVDNYEREKAEILKQYEEDKSLYGEPADGGKYVRKAIEEIDFQLKILKDSFKEKYDEPNQLPSLKSLSLKDSNEELNDSNCFFFYQTSFHSTTRYFLSSLDTRILLRTYGAYCNFPPTLLLNVENISYGLMVTEKVLKKYKFMNHLPLGTELAILEINWSNMRLPREVYQEFEKDLQERHRKAKNKVKREDLAKKRFENYQELKTMEFYQSEGSLINSSQETPVFHEDISPIHQNTDHVPSPPVSPELTGQVVSTVWGTKIPKSSIPVPVEEPTNDDWDLDELIKKAQVDSMNDSNGGKKKMKGRKKKLLLVTNNARGGY